MKTKRLTWIAVLALLTAALLSACSGGSQTSTNWHGLSADADRAYLSNGGFVFAVDLKNGAQLWRFPAEADSKLMFYAAPVLTEDGQLLAGSAGSNHALFSLDPATGKENWAQPFSKNKGAWIASPLALNGAIYAPNTDGFLYTLDMQGKESAAPIELGGALWSAPAAANGLLYVSSLDHHLHILNPANPAEIQTIDVGGALPSSAVPAQGGVYVGSFASKVTFVTSDGAVKTIAEAKNWIWGAPMVDGETLYYADLSGNIVSVNLKSGQSNWNAAQSGDSVVGSLLAQGGQIYAALESGSLIALDQDGKLVWDKTVGGKIYTAPIAANDLILVAPYQADFALAAYDAQGKQAWTFTPEK
ncbi:MAG: hypothetical protein Fur002_12110 [Anaerolineales bacterium]